LKGYCSDRKPSEAAVKDQTARSCSRSCHGGGCGATAMMLVYCRPDGFVPSPTAV
jgi:hypothetical protein